MKNDPGSVARNYPWHNESGNIRKRQSAGRWRVDLSIGQRIKDGNSKVALSVEQGAVRTHREAIESCPVRSALSIDHGRQKLTCNRSGRDIDCQNRVHSGRTAQITQSVIRDIGGFSIRRYNDPGGRYKRSKRNRSDDLECGSIDDLDLRNVLARRIQTLADPKEFAVRRNRNAQRASSAGKLDHSDSTAVG